MTTLCVRDQSGFREARPTDVLEHARALLAQRHRVGWADPPMRQHQSVLATRLVHEYYATIMAYP